MAGSFAIRQSKNDSWRDPEQRKAFPLCDADEKLTAFIELQAAIWVV